jgi:hypothetical protein
MTLWAHLWNRMKAVPVGVWAALGAGLALFVMYLRGRRLEAEVVRATMKTMAARAAAESARSEGRAETHMAKAAEHGRRALALEEAREKILGAEKTEQKRLAALPPDKVTSEFLKLAERKKAQ